MTRHSLIWMALFRTHSAAVFGIDAHLIDVEVDMYPAGTQRDFVTVGMPDTAVRESRERIKSALMNSGFGYPNKSVTINLAPANVRKEGAGFDLPMAMGILGAMGVVTRSDQYLLVGELSLDGSLRPVRGALSIAVCARSQGIRTCWCRPTTPPRPRSPKECACSGSRHLAEVVTFLNQPDKFQPTPFECAHAGDSEAAIARFSRRARTDDGQARAGSGGRGRPQRADDRAAGLGQNDAGATLRRSILPPLTFQEALETTQVHSVAGVLPQGVGLMTRAAVPRAASHDFRRGADRRRLGHCRGRAR